MKFRSILLLSFLFGNNDPSLTDKIQTLNRQIASLKAERWKLHKQLYVQSQKNVVKLAKKRYYDITHSKSVLTFLQHRKPLIKAILGNQDHY